MKFFRKLLIILFVSLLSALFVVMIAYQVYLNNSASIVTETTIYDTVHESITVSGLIVRSETTFEEPTAGVLDYLVENGEKINSGGIIARQYASIEDVHTQEEIDRLSSRIEQLKESESIDFSLSNLDTIESKIRTLLCRVTEDVSRGDAASVTSDRESLEFLMNQKKIILGEVENFDGQVSELNEERERLRSTLNNSFQDVYAPASGYFVDSLDGYETILTPSMLENMTVSQYSSLPKPESVSAPVGYNKIISDFTWYFTCVLSEKDAESFEAGQSIELCFSFNLDKTYPGIVYAVSAPENGSRVISVKCASQVRELYTKRSASVQLITRSYTGLRVNAKAVRIDEDGSLYVYVKIGDVAVRRNVERIYSSSSYYIVAEKNTAQDGLYLYDEVIVEGSDLYDGKLIQ